MENPANFLLRRSERSDLPQLLLLLAPLRSTAFNWSEKSFRGEFEYSQTWVYQEVGQQVGQVADELAKIKALICLRDATDAWEISIVATAVQFQKKGVMEAMMKALMERLGGERHLWLEVHEDNVIAQKLYQKLGFETNHRRGGYYSDGSAAIVMSLPARILKP